MNATEENQQLKAALTNLLSNAKWSGGHLTEPLQPSHASVLEAKLLLDRLNPTGTPITIQINGRPLPFSGREISYEDIVRLGGKNPEISWSITYGFRGVNGGGTLCPGQKTAAVPWMVICIVNTGCA